MFLVLEKGKLTLYKDKKSAYGSGRQNTLTIEAPRPIKGATAIKENHKDKPHVFRLT